MQDDHKDRDQDTEEVDARLRARWSSTKADEPAAPRPRVDRPRAAGRVAPSRRDTRSEPAPPREGARPFPLTPMLIAFGAAVIIGVIVGALGSFQAGRFAAVARGGVTFAGGFVLVLALIPLRRNEHATSSNYSLGIIGGTTITLLTSVVFSVVVAGYTWDDYFSLWGAFWFGVKVFIFLSGVGTGVAKTHDETLDVV